MKSSLELTSLVANSWWIECVQAVEGSLSLPLHLRRSHQAERIAPTDCLNRKGSGLGVGLRIGDAVPVSEASCKCCLLAYAIS